jgi:hypothetical protein
MNETPWTPGPWTIARDDRGWIQGIQPLSPDDGRHEKGVTYWAAYADDAGLDVTEADASLIALAPDIAEAILAATHAEINPLPYPLDEYAPKWMHDLYDVADRLRAIKGDNNEQD